MIRAISVGDLDIGIGIDQRYGLDIIDEDRLRLYIESQTY